MGCHFLLQGIFPTQGSNTCLLLLLHWQVDSLPLPIFQSPTESVFSNTIDENDIKKLESGITLGDGTECLPAKVSSFVTADGLPAAEIKIREGKYHQVKRMFHALGNNVEQLRRIQIGSLKLDFSLAEGESRELTEEELELVFKDEE